MVHDDASPTPDRPPLTRGQALTRVAIAYLAAFWAGALTMLGAAALGWSSPLIQLGLADLVATVVVFAFSVRHDNSSVYDAYWSVIPIWIAADLVWIGWDSGANHGRMVLVFALVCFWGVRLTHNWARGWTGFDHEDWRYRNIRAVTGRWHWLVSFLGIHLFPTVLVFLGCLPLFAICLEPGRPLGGLDLLAALVGFGAVIIELVADNQLRAYVLHDKRPGETFTGGLWAWSRHPNYFGEMMFWWGLYLFAVAAVGWRPWWMIAGALAMTALFNFISIPMIDARHRKRRRDYAEVEARISRVVPWVPKRR